MLAEEHVRFFVRDSRGQSLIVGLMGELNLEVHYRYAVVPAQVHPALAEGTSVDREGLLLGRDIVLHDRGHRTRAGAGVDDGLASFAVYQVEENPG